jgi:hypothetical protein
MRTYLSAGGWGWGANNSFPVSSVHLHHKDHIVGTTVPPSHGPSYLCSYPPPGGPYVRPEAVAGEVPAAPRAALLPGYWPPAPVGGRGALPEPRQPRRQVGKSLQPQARVRSAKFCRETLFLLAKVPVKTLSNSVRKFSRKCKTYFKSYGTRLIKRPRCFCFWSWLHPPPPHPPSANIAIMANPPASLLVFLFTTYWVV